jgi:hypothetical protein
MIRLGGMAPKRQEWGQISSVDLRGKKLLESGIG